MPAKRKRVADEMLDRRLAQMIRDSRQIDRRPRFERAVSTMARLHPGCRFVGLSAKGMVVWPGLGRFFTEVTLDGAGSAWVDLERRMWLWQPPSGG